MLLAKPDLYTFYILRQVRKVRRCDGVLPSHRRNESGGTWVGSPHPPPVWMCTAATAKGN